MVSDLDHENNYHIIFCGEEHPVLPNLRSDPSKIPPLPLKPGLSPGRGQGIPSSAGSALVWRRYILRISLLFRIGETKSA